MFRLNTLFKQIEPQLTKSNKAGSAELKKFQQLFTQITHGFDPNQPPSNVVLYREAASLYNRGEYISAEQVLKDALSKAKEEKCSDTVIGLYEDQLLKVQGVIKSSEKTSWLKTALKLMGATGSVFSTGFYLGSRRTGILVP